MYKSNCIQFLCFSPRTKNFIVSRRKFPKQPVAKDLETYLRFNISFLLQQVKPDYHQKLDMAFASQIADVGKCLVSRLFSANKKFGNNSRKVAKQSLVR